MFFVTETGVDREPLPRALRTSLWDLVSRRRERTLAEAGRVIAIALAGLVALFAPGLALSVAMVVSGAVLLLFAFAGGRLLVQPYLPAEASGAPEAVRVAPVAMAGVRIVVLLGVGVGAAALLLRLRPQPECPRAQQQVSDLGSLLPLLAVARRRDDHPRPGAA